MKYEENAKQSKARQIWKQIFMLRKGRLEIFQKNKKLGP